MNDANDALVGRTVDRRYRVLSHIADGGMASVYVAHDSRLERRVALKVMRSDLTRDPAFVDRFRREAQSAAQLSHPNVVAVHDQGEDGPLMFLIMELVPGQTLRAWLHDVGVLTVREALTVCESILAALGAAHRVGLMHRDIKPENILISDDGTVKVADFGLARVVSASTSSQANGVLGTVAYLSPEQVESGASDARSDVYSAGLVLFEMLTGVKAVQGDSPIHVAYQHVHGSIAAPSEFIPHLPPDLDALVAWATQRDPNRRPPHAMAMLERMVAIRQSLSPAQLDARPPTSHLRAPSPPPLPTPGAPLTGHRPRASQPGLVEAVRRWRGHPALPHIEVPSWLRPPTEAGPRRTYMAAVGVISALVLAVLLFQWNALVGPGAQRTVPSVAGNSVAVAESSLRTADLTPVVRDEFNERIPAGIVIGTSPAGNTQVSRGDEVAILVSKGPEKLQVPDIRNKPLAEARGILERGKISLREPPLRSYSDTVPRDVVISTDPAPGTPTKIGFLVSVTVSDGPQPVQAGDIIGKNFEQAKAFLAGKGITLTPGEQVFSDKPAGTIVSINPASGPFASGVTISAAVSKGNENVYIPLVRGMSKEQAVQALEAAGLVVEVVYEPLLPGVVTNRAIGTLPRSGSLVARGTVVKLGIN